MPEWRRRMCGKMLLLSLLIATTADWAGVRGKRLGGCLGAFVGVVLSLQYAGSAIVQALGTETANISQSIPAMYDTLFFCLICYILLTWMRA